MSIDEVVTQLATAIREAPADRLEDVLRVFVETVAPSLPREIDLSQPAPGFVDYSYVYSGGEPRSLLRREVDIALEDLRRPCTPLREAIWQSWQIWAREHVPVEMIEPFLDAVERTGAAVLAERKACIAFCRERYDWDGVDLAAAIGRGEHRKGEPL